MADPIADLPDDARRLVLSHLPLKSLLRCEAVSKQLHTAVVEDVVWQPRCKEHWPAANLGSTVATYRSCFRSANGWAHLTALPRAVDNAVSDGQRTSRRSAPVPCICAFDVGTDAQVCATGQKARLRWAGRQRTFEWEDQPSLSLADVKLLPGSEGDTPRPLGLFHRGRATQLALLGAEAPARGGGGAEEAGVAALPAPLWSSERATFDDLLVTGDAARVLLLSRKAAAWPLGPSVLSLDLHRPAGHMLLGRHAEGDFYELRSACNDPVRHRQ